VDLFFAEKVQSASNLKIKLLYRVSEAPEPVCHAIISVRLSLEMAVVGEVAWAVSVFSRKFASGKHGSQRVFTVQQFREEEVNR
jgi:hypothetical protein